jgi:hypothetical protein
VPNRPHIEVDGLQTAKRPLHGRQAFVGAYGALCGEGPPGHAGAEHIDPIECGFRRG